MGGLTDYMPRHGWAAVLLLAGVAALGLFIPPSAGAVVGLSRLQHVAVVAVVELSAAIGIAAIVVYYRNPDAEYPEWRHGP